VAVFFLVAGGVTFSARALLLQDPTGSVMRIVAERSARQGVNQDVYFERMESRFKSTYSVLINLSALAYAFALWVVERRRRKPWLVHLAAGVHYLCVTFLLSALVFGFARVADIDVLTLQWIGFSMMAVLGVYIALMLRRLYGDSTGWAIIKTLFVLLVGSIADSIIAYGSLGLALITA
jgi:hypothetical protein